MAWHTVLQGEWLAQIARKYGFSDAGTLHDHPSNAEFRRKRPNGAILKPGDRIFIPEKQQKEVQVPTGKRSTFRLMLPKTKLRIVLHDDAGEPIKNEPYKLNLGDDSYTGTSGGDGLIEIRIPVKETGEGALEVAGRMIPIRLGHLNPLDEVSGVQARLHNLGYDCGPINDEVSSHLSEALRVFQKTHGLEETGQIDETTRTTLKEVYGC